MSSQVLRANSEDRHSAWKRDTEYLASLNLHIVIAEHVRISCRKAQVAESITNWVKLDNAHLDLPGLAEAVATAIRNAWKEQTTLSKKAKPKFSELKLDDIEYFHRGLENIIGYPPTHTHLLEAMRREHEHGTEFTDHKERRFVPKVEWNVVMRSDTLNIIGADDDTPYIPRRVCVEPLSSYVATAAKMFSGSNFDAVTEAEVAALRLWTGPMHKEYAKVLRNSTLQTSSASVSYVATLHAINSGITKLARIWRLPANRKVYRGYRNRSLNDVRSDAHDCIGGVEKCVLATSEDFKVAIDYSEDGAFILEINVGQVNRGADVSWLSQFPHEKEVLFNALSNIEFVGSPQLRHKPNAGSILVYEVCVSANLRSKTLEQFVTLRKDLHLHMVDVHVQQALQNIHMLETGNSHEIIKVLGKKCREQADVITREAEVADVSLFNKGTAYLRLMDTAIMFPARSMEVMNMTLDWFNTQKAAPAELEVLLGWQLQALRGAFKESTRPRVTAVILEQDHHVGSVFEEKHLKLGAVHRGDAVCNVAKLLSLNPNLESLEMEVDSAASWDAAFKELCPNRPRFRVNGFYLAKYNLSTLQQLELRNSGGPMAAMIAPALQLHPPIALTSLSLCGTPIACAGAESLGRAFTGLSRLRYLDLRTCQIADRGCSGIAQSLSALSELEELTLAHNKVNNDGFNFLASIIQEYLLTRLKSVDMRFNTTHLPTVTVTLQCGARCMIKNHCVSKLSVVGLVQCVAWSPGGDQIASASDDGTVIIWDAKNSEQVSTLKGHTAEVTCVAWRPGSPGRPGGDQIASASWDETVIIWDAKTGEQISTLKGHTNFVTSVAWRPGSPGHPGGDQIVSGGCGCGTAGEILIWDMKTWDQLSILKGHTGKVKNVAWRGDQIRVASTSESLDSDKTIIIWHGATGKMFSTLKGHTGFVTSVAWRPGGDQFASGSNDKTIIIWDAETGDQVSTLIGHTGKVKSVAWCPWGDQIASGSDDYKIIIWDSQTGHQVSTLKFHCRTVTSVTWSPGGDQIVAGGCGAGIYGAENPEKISGIISIWDAKTGEKISTLKDHTQQVTSVAWRPGGEEIASSSSSDCTIIIWNTKIGEQISKLKGHTGAITSVAWRPGGDQFASASEDMTIIIWDAESWSQVSTLTGHTKSVTTVAWSPGGDQIASGDDDGAILIWDAKTVDQLDDTEPLQSVVWSPGGDHIASGSRDDNTVIILDAMTGDQVSTLQGHTAWIFSLAWRPVGDQIATASGDENVIIWDAKTGVQVSTLKGHNRTVLSVAWHPGGDQIASGSGDQTIIIWDAKTGEQVSTLKGHTGTVSSVAWRPGGDQIASGSYDKTLIIWNPKTGDKISKLQGHLSRVQNVAWRPGGDQVASGSRDRTIMIWDTKTGEQIFRLRGHNKPVTSVTWRPGGDQISSASWDKTIIIWDAKNGEQISTLKGHSELVPNVMWSPGGDRIVSGSENNQILIWNVRTCGLDQISKLTGHSNSVMSVVWSPGGDKIASGSRDKTIIIWDARTGEEVSKLEGHNAGVNSVAWSPGGDRIASGSLDSTIIIWDAKTGEQVLALKGHTGRVRSVAWHPGGDQIASGSYDQTIIIWDTKTGDQVAIMKGHTHVVTSVAWRPGGTGIASASLDKTNIIWDVKSGIKVLILRCHTKLVMSVAWSPRGDQIASGSDDKTIIIWDAKTGDQTLILTGHTAPVSSVAWSPIGDLIASGAHTSSVMVWDAKTGERLLTLKGHTGRVQSVAWSPGGDRIASSSDDRTIIIWDAKQAVSASRDNAVVVWNFESGKQGSKQVGDISALTTSSAMIIDDMVSCESMGGSAESLGISSKLQQAVIQQSDAAASDNVTMCAAFRSSDASDDQGADTDAGCCPPPPKKKKTH